MVRVEGLDWDDWNVAHIAKHAVSPAEVEEFCRGEHIVRQAHSGRLMLIGSTAGGRLLAIILAPEAGDDFYPVTARPADRRERTDYRTEKVRKDNDN